MLSITCLQGALVLSIATGFAAQPSPLATTLVAPVGALPTLAATAGIKGACFALDGARVRAEFDKALAKHTKAVEETDSHKARAKLEAKHPARKYWRKFASEARKGDGQSVAWMVEYARLAGFDEKKALKELKAAIAILSAKHAGADWIGATLEYVHAQRKFVGEQNLRPLYESVAEQNVSDSNKATAMYRLAWMDKRAGNTKESERRFQNLADNYRKTKFGTTAASTRTSKAEVDAGGSAPDFYAETLEGHGVSLSDYRGKVVLLDFYGFW